MMNEKKRGVEVDGVGHGLGQVTDKTYLDVPPGGFSVAGDSSAKALEPVPDAPEEPETEEIEK